MSRSPRLAAAALPFALAPLALLSPAGAQTGTTEEPEVAETGTTETAIAETPAAPDPAARREETLLVEASLPYLPTSNTIATKLPMALAATPANVGVVSGPLIEEQRAVVLSDALENVSGLNVQTGFGLFDFFVVRGFDSLTSGLVLTDGAPEPEATFYQLYNAERVEVLKGPAGFLYGPNPLAGAVNIVRKQPVPTDFTVVEAAAGSFDTLDGRLDLNRSFAGGAAAFRLNGLWRQSDGWRDGRENEVAAVNPAFTWRPGERTTINLNLEHLASDFIPDAGLPIVGTAPADVPRRRSYASPFDRSEQKVNRFQLDVERQLGDELTLRNKLYYRELDWVTDGTFFQFLFPDVEGRPQIFRALLGLDDRQRFLGNQLEATFGATTGNARHRLLVGLEVARLDDVFTLDAGLLPPIDLLSPAEFAVEPPPRFPFQSGDTRSEIVAPYLIDQIELTERVSVLVGARWDAIDFEDGVTGTSRSDGELSPILGAVVQPIEGLAFYANVAESFASASPRLAGERRPEESRQFELGVRRALLDDRLRTTVALFQIERDNIAIPDDNGITQQAGDQRARGVELELAAETRDGLRLFLAYAYTDSELTRFTEFVVDPFTGAGTAFDRSGNRSAFSPEHLANAWASRRLGRRWTVGGGLRWVGEQFIAEDNVTRLDGYLLLDAAVILRHGPWRWSLHLDNLTDQDYETRGFGALSVIPGRPFAAALGVAYRL